MNAAAPPDCCVSMTAQLVMYYNSTQLNSTVAVGDVPRALCLLCQSTKCVPLKGMLHWRKYTTFTLLCINSIIYLEAICP